MNNNSPNSNNSKEQIGGTWLKKKILALIFESGAEAFLEESPLGKYNTGVITNGGAIRASL